MFIDKSWSNISKQAQQIFYYFICFFTFLKSNIVLIPFEWIRYWIKYNCTFWYILLVKTYFYRNCVAFFWDFGTWKFLIENKLSFSGLRQLFWVTLLIYLTGSDTNVHLMDCTLKPSFWMTATSKWFQMTYLSEKCIGKHKNIIDIIYSEVSEVVPSQ